MFGTVTGGPLDRPVHTSFSTKRVEHHLPQKVSQCGHLGRVYCKEGCPYPVTGKGNSDPPGP